MCYVCIYYDAWVKQSWSSSNIIYLIYIFINFSGQSNLEITLTTLSTRDTQLILNELGPEAQISYEDPSQLVINIPNSTELPDFLDNLEVKKVYLGIMGISVSSMSLDEIFLKYFEKDKYFDIFINISSTNWLGLPRKIKKSHYRPRI